jgi:hypothetical protein
LTWKLRLFIDEQSNERTANHEQHNTKEVSMKPQETMKVGMMPQWMTTMMLAWCPNECQWMSYDGMEASKRLGLAKLHISIILRAPDKINRAKSAAIECNDDKAAWKLQELLHDEQYGYEAATTISWLWPCKWQMPLYKPTWKSQLLNDEQYNMRTAHRWAV